MSGSLAKSMPEHMRLLSDPQMMRTLINQAVVKIGGLDEMVTWAKRNDDNQGKLYALATRVAPKEVAVSGSIGIEAYIDAIDAAERAGMVIDGDYVPVEVEDASAPMLSLFLWPDCFYIDTDIEPEHT